MKTRRNAADLLINWLDQSILEVARKREKNPPEMRLFEKIVFFLAGKAGAISHTVPCYQIALEKGVEWLVAETRRQAKLAGTRTKEATEKADFYEAMATALEGVLAYAANLSKKAAQLAAKEKPGPHKDNLLAMSKVCASVPARPPRSSVRR